MKLKLFFATLMGTLLLLAPSCGDDKKTETPDLPSPTDPTITLTLGTVGEEEVEILVATSYSARAAAFFLPAEEPAPDAETIFGFGQEIIPSDEAQSVMLTPLLPERSYRVYALSANDEGRLSELSTLEFTTLASTKMLRRGETTKRSFSFEVVLPEEKANASYMYTYLEAETFEYMMRQQQMTDGADFDYDALLKNIIASYGFLDQGSKSITWSAGDPNEWRNPYVATIVGGKRYYVMMVLSNEEGSEFYGEACAIDLTTEPAGESSASMNVQFEEVTTSGIRVRMECSEDIAFYFYNMVSKSSWDEKRARDGEEGMMNYLYEYGWPAANTYTDSWGVEHSTEYMLGIFGVDVNGDTFLQEHPITSEAVVPSIAVTLKPYERDLLGLHAYDTFYVDVIPYYFDSLDVEMWAIFDERGRVDEAMQAAGTTLQEFAANPTMELIEKLGDFIEPLPQDEHEILIENGYLSGLYNNFKPETEYCYLLVIPNRGKLYCGYATSSTEPFYGGGEATEAYSAFLGEWTVFGTTTEDYYTRKSYTLRVEPLTVNRSYKIYGWSMGEISQEFPFEARFIPTTGRLSIQGAQMLGVKEIEGEEHIIVLNGYFSYGGELGMLGGYDGTFYDCRCDGTHLSMFPQLFYYNGAAYEFKTIGYTSLIAGNYFTLEGEEYNLINFSIDRPTNTYAASALRRTPLKQGPKVRLFNAKSAGEIGAERPLLPTAPVRSFKR